jgi:hypothetical protein
MTARGQTAIIRHSVEGVAEDPNQFEWEAL